MVYHARKPRYWLHMLLLGLTLFTTLVVGARMQYNFQHNLPCFYAGDDGLDIFPWQWALHPANLALGIPFSFSLLLILMAHEMGHYLYCRRYGVWATLPFFIPFPRCLGPWERLFEFGRRSNRAMRCLTLGLQGRLPDS